MTQETPWVPVEEVCHLYGLTFRTAKKNISAGTFPVETYKVGKIIVIDKAVHAAYFAKHRKAGLDALETTKR